MPSRRVLRWVAAALGLFAALAGLCAAAAAGITVEPLGALTEDET